VNVLASLTPASEAVFLFFPKKPKKLLAVLPASLAAAGVLAAVFAFFFSALDLVEAGAAVSYHDSLGNVRSIEMPIALRPW